MNASHGFWVSWVSLGSMTVGGWYCEAAGGLPRKALRTKPRIRDPLQSVDLFLSQALASMIHVCSASSPNVTCHHDVSQPQPRAAEQVGSRASQQPSCASSILILSEAEGRTQEGVESWWCCSDSTTVSARDSVLCDAGEVKAKTVEQTIAGLGVETWAKAF